MTRLKSKRLTSQIIQLTIIYLFVNILVIAQGQLSFRKRVSTDNCERLPPPSNSTTQDQQNNQDQHESNPAEVIQNILVNGMKKLPLQTHEKSAIMILGNTGSGKTTTSLTINGDHNRIRAVRTYKGNFVIVDDDDKIGAPSTTSKTLVPEYIVNPNNSQAFYDCPGFDDNRGPEMDIAAMYFVNAITEHITRAKFLFTVTHSSIRIGNDRNDFDLLAKHATRFLRRIDKMNQSIALVITKVNSFDAQRGEYLSDEDILEEAGEFLLSYHKRLTDQLKIYTEAAGGGSNSEIQEVRRKIIFVESLLEQDEEGYFTRIWFLRSPKNCGPYSNMPYAAQVRQKIIDMYTNNMVYTNVTPSDFGFTLKDATMLKIKDTFIPAVKRAIIDSTNETLHDLKSDYFQEFRAKFNATGAEKVVAVLELEQHFDSLRQSQRSIMDYRKGAAEKVLEIARALGNRNVDQDFVKQTQLREKCLKFFRGLEDAVDGVVAQSDSKTFAGLGEIFEVFLRDITQFHSDVTLDLLRGALPETRSMIDDTSKDVMLAMYEGYMAWFNQTLPTDPIGALTSFTREHKNLEQFYQALNESSGAAVASTGLEYLRSRIFPNVNYPSISQGIANIKILETQLSKLVNLTGATSLQATFSPVEIVMSFRAMKTHLLNLLQNSLIPEQQEKIKEAAQQVTLDFLDKYSRQFLSLMNSTDPLVTRAAIKNLETDHAVVETYWATNSNTAPPTVSGVMEQIFSKLQFTPNDPDSQQQQQQHFQLLIDLENHLADLRRSVEIADVGETRIIETVILHFSHEFTAFRNKVHHLIREERIPSLVNAMETSTQEILTTLLGDYFDTMGNNLKEGGPKGAAALKLLHKECTHMKQLEETQLRQKSNFSVRGQINEIFSSLENIPQKDSYLTELESNEESITFLQNIVRNKNRAKPTAGALVGLSAVVLNFLRQFQFSCAAARKGESSAVPNGVKRIEVQVKQALRQIHDSYLSQFTTLQENEKLDAYKNFLDDFKKLQIFYKYIDDHSGSVIEQLHDVCSILWSRAGKAKAPNIQPQCETIQKVQNQLQSYLQIGDDTNDVKIVVAFGPQFVKEVFQPFQDQRSTILNEIEDITIPDILARMHSAGVSSIRNFINLYGDVFNEKFVAAGNSTDSVIAAMKTDVGAILSMFSTSSVGGIVPLEAEPIGSVSISTELENVFSSSDVYNNAAEPDEHLAILKALELQLDSVKKSFKMTKLDQGKQHVARTLLSTFQIQLAAFRDKIVTTDALKKEKEAAERREREWQEQRRREREDYEARQKRMEEEWKHRNEELVQMRKEHHDNQIKMQEQMRIEREEARKRDELQQQNFLKQLEALKKALTPPPPPPPPPRRPWYKRIFG